LALRDERARVLPTEVDREGEEQRSGPPVHRVERERLLVSRQVGDQPNDEPKKRHWDLFLRIVASAPG